MGYDLLMLAILAFTTIRGAAKGMAWQLAAIAALVLCFVFATPLSLVVAPAIHLDPPLNRWVAMLGIYLVFSFGCFAVARLLRGWLEDLKFTEYDRHLGALFGLLKGATLCLVITFFSVCLSERACDYIMRTRSGRAAGEALEQLTLVMPSELQSVLRPHLRHFDENHLAYDSPDSANDADANPGNEQLLPDDREVGSFRGSALPDEDRPERADAERESNDDERTASDEDESVEKRGLVGTAVSALEERLKTGIKRFFNDALDAQNRGPDQRSESPAHPASRNRPPGKRPSPEAADSIPVLMDAVGELFSDNARKRSEHQAQIEALLHGIPPSVAAAALRDWRADLLGTGVDPDPETDAETSLDRRLARQLRAAGRSLEELPRPLRERLREADSE